MTTCWQNQAARYGPLRPHREGCANTSPDTQRLMIKTVLAQRFYLAIDREQKSRTVSALVVAEGGPKLRPAMGLV